MTVTMCVLKMEASNGSRNARVRKARKVKAKTNKSQLWLINYTCRTCDFYFFFVFGQIRFEGKVCVGSHLSKRRGKNLINIFGKDNFYCKRHYINKTEPD